MSVLVNGIKCFNILRKYIVQIFNKQFKYIFLIVLLTSSTFLIESLLLF